MAVIEELQITQAMDALRHLGEQSSDEEVLRCLPGSSTRDRRQLETAIAVARNRLRREITITDDIGKTRNCYTIPAAVHLLKQWYVDDTDRALSEAWNAAVQHIPEPGDAAGLQSYATTICHETAVRLGHRNADDRFVTPMAPADRAGLHVWILVGAEYAGENAAVDPDQEGAKSRKNLP